MTSEQVQDLNDWMKHHGILNVHEVIAQNYRKPHALENNLKFITQGKTCYIQSNVMVSLSLMISYIKHRQYSAKSKYFGPSYYIQIDPQDYDEWRVTPLRKKYTSPGPMMRMNTKTYSLMIIKSFSKRIFAVSILNP